MALVKACAFVAAGPVKKSVAAAPVMTPINPLRPLGYGDRGDAKSKSTAPANMRAAAPVSRPRSPAGSVLAAVRSRARCDAATVTLCRQPA
jgi:hypothetical protein